MTEPGRWSRLFLTACLPIGVVLLIGGLATWAYFLAIGELDLTPTRLITFALNVGTPLSLIYLGWQWRHRERAGK